MALTTREDELTLFKTEINFCEYLASQGYALDRRKSGRRSMVMRHADGSKLIVSRRPNRQWVYFNVHDDRDRGTIIDFVQGRSRSSLGEVRKELRGWTGLSPADASRDQPLPELSAIRFDRGEVHAAWENARPINGLQPYLEKQRRVPSRVLREPRFADRIRTDRRGNALFAHFDSDGLCGFEVKNRGFTGFSPGGAKRLFCSRPSVDDTELVVCETAIDTLSYAALFGVDGRRFVSTAGQVSLPQRELLLSAGRRMPPAAVIVLATDNDAAGRKLAGTLAELLSPLSEDGKTIKVHTPEREGEDWNDVLRRTPQLKSLFPSPG